MSTNKSNEIYTNVLKEKNILIHSKDNNTKTKNVIPPVKPKEKKTEE